MRCCFNHIIGLPNNFRHSDEVEANFIVSEKEYLGSIILKEPNHQAIYSNMKDMAEQHRHISEGFCLLLTN
jgi:hypothetical protein